VARHKTECTRCRCKLCRQHRRELAGGIQALMVGLTEVLKVLGSQGTALAAVGPALVNLSRGLDTEFNRMAGGINANTENLDKVAVALAGMTAVVIEPGRLGPSGGEG
jgi:hypothetical protein